jgi:hypothetical protein
MCLLCFLPQLFERMILGKEVLHDT